MLDELHVSDVALIHDATLVPSSGLTVLTGETGAGKTALLSAVKLLVGERADAGAVREGADHLEVEGRLVERGGDPDGFVVRRSVSSDGRGRVQLDGRMASARELAERVEDGKRLISLRLVEIRDDEFWLEGHKGKSAEKTQFIGRKPEFSQRALLKEAGLAAFKQRFFLRFGRNVFFLCLQAGNPVFNNAKVAED